MAILMRLVAENVNGHTDTHTVQTQTKCRNPRCACAPRVNEDELTVTNRGHFLRVGSLKGAALIHCSIYKQHSDLNRLTGLSVLTRLILSPPVTHETSLAHMTGDLPGNVSLTASLTDSLLRYPCRWLN